MRTDELCRRYLPGASEARAGRIPIVVHKLGQSEQGARITLTHTASLAGEQQSAAVLLKRLGLTQARSVPAFLETLKLLHTTGPLSGRAIASMSCSGGEAALMADALAGRRLQARALTTRQRQRVAVTLNNLVTVSNPLDYHTFIWGNEQRLKATFGAMLSCRFDLCLLVIDPPRTDRCRDRDWRIAIHAYRDALADTGARGALLAVLPESLDETRSAAAWNSPFPVTSSLPQSTHASRCRRSTSVCLPMPPPSSCPAAYLSTSPWICC